MNQPFVVAYGMGVDSTAMLIGLSGIGVRPDLILFADVGGEKDETYAYQAIMDQFLESVGFPAITVVRYTPQDFKNWPPYHTLEENCLTNGTLPSLAFGFGSCSQKWKVAPQNQFCNAWEPALVAQVPTQIVAYQEAFAQGEEIPTWDQFFCSLSAITESEP